MAKNKVYEVNTMEVPTEIPVVGKLEIVKTEKEKLLELYQTLKDLNVRSISDLENLIANCK